MKKLTYLMAVVFFSIITTSNSYGYSDYYELLNDSTIEINGTISSLSGSFSFSKNFLLINDPNYIPPDPLYYNVINIDITGGGEDVQSSNFQYNVPLLWGHVSTANGMIQEMHDVPVNQVILSSTPETVTFINKVLVPTNILDTQYNYTSSSLSGYQPDEVLFNYLLTEMTFSGVYVDPSSGQIVPGGWDINLDSSDVIGSLSIHAANVSPVPLPGAVWLFGSGLASLVVMNRKPKKCKSLPE